MVVHTHLPANEAYKKVFTRISNSFSPQLTFMCPCDFYRYEHYILTERRNFKTFWKENLAISLDSCYLFNVENGTEHDVDSAYGVCIH